MTGQIEPVGYCVIVLGVLLCFTLCCQFVIEPMLRSPAKTSYHNSSAYREEAFSAETDTAVSREEDTGEPTHWTKTVYFWIFLVVMILNTSPGVHAVLPQGQG